MDVVVAPRQAHTVSRLLPRRKILGNSTLERLRSGVIAMLGATTALGLGLLAFALQLGGLSFEGGPPPSSAEHPAVARATPAPPGPGDPSARLRERRLDVAPGSVAVTPAPSVRRQGDRGTGSSLSAGERISVPAPPPVDPVAKSPPAKAPSKPVGPGPAPAAPTQPSPPDPPPSISAPPAPAPAPLAVTGSSGKSGNGKGYGRGGRPAAERPMPADAPAPEPAAAAPSEASLGGSGHGHAYGHDK